MATWRQAIKRGSVRHAAAGDDADGRNGRRAEVRWSDMECFAGSQLADPLNGSMPPALARTSTCITTIAPIAVRPLNMAWALPPHRRSRLTMQTAAPAGVAPVDDLSSCHANDPIVAAAIASWACSVKGRHGVQRAYGSLVRNWKRRETGPAAVAVRVLALGRLISTSFHSASITTAVR